MGHYNLTLWQVATRTSLNSQSGDRLVADDLCANFRDLFRAPFRPVAWCRMTKIKTAVHSRVLRHIKVIMRHGDAYRNLPVWYPFISHNFQRGYAYEIATFRYLFGYRRWFGCFDRPSTGSCGRQSSGHSHRRRTSSRLAPT
jgi:hypothetical protein